MKIEDRLKILTEEVKNLQGIIKNRIIQKNHDGVNMN